MMDDWWAVYEVYKKRKEEVKKEKPMPPTNEWKGTFHAITTSGAYAQPKLGFDESVEKDVAAYLATVDLEESSPREKQLLEFLQEAADKACSSIWKEKSLTYTLRGRPSPGLAEQKSELMRQTGKRTRQFLADLDEGRI
ncbi:uncharacterized protein BO80DRAFT_469821 [Aspergillus ibericus CBS 121593]|uniref:Uncharacterized protein n=1 Tax=Aspergillus ibericus CBS 121593 TaxID=1448316 RepID=A0A395GHL9_9EURO|nr:hypothetical protein BO80DRAFT_469821 [Aspergillus ibericus CBS 121593]RAK94905.1 hypothetical protein BO80DRAFT_469821 [Aspergillus ibericus CBS 121593]